MNKIAVDVVLLPDDKMMNFVIESNKFLVHNYNSEIILNKNDFLPHISLAMGVIDYSDLNLIDDILSRITSNLPAMNLTVLENSINSLSSGDNLSVLNIKENSKLQSIHYSIMDSLLNYFSYDIDREMFFVSENEVNDISNSTIAAIKNFPVYSSYGNFSPHITVGFGELNEINDPIDFTASRLALCHLGNYCTCRQVILLNSLRDEIC